MNKKFFRIYIHDSATNYYYLAGGILDELIAKIIECDQQRNDGIAVHQAVILYMTQVNKPMNNKVFYEDRTKNGFSFHLYDCGEIELEDEQKK